MEVMIQKCAMPAGFLRNLGFCLLHSVLNSLPSLVVLGNNYQADRRVMALAVILSAAVSLALASTAACAMLGINVLGRSLFERALRSALMARAVMVGLILAGLGAGFCGIKPAFVAAFYLSPDLWCRAGAWIFGRWAWHTFSPRFRFPRHMEESFITEYLLSLVTFFLLLLLVLIVAIIVMGFLGRCRSKRIRAVKSPQQK